MGLGLRSMPLVLAAGLSALGVAGLAGAQQGGETPTGAPVQASSAPLPAEGPPPSAETAPKEAEASARSDTEAETDERAGPAPSGAATAPEKAVEPLKRPRYAIAVLEALDKVTAETIRFEAPVGQPVRYKSLVFTVRACETNAPDEDFPEAAAHVEIDSAPLARQGESAAAPRRLFRGWMYANAPGVNLFENPAYDAWVIACKTVSPAA